MDKATTSKVISGAREVIANIPKNSSVEADLLKSVLLLQIGVLQNQIDILDRLSKIESFVEYNNLLTSVSPR